MTASSVLRDCASFEKRYEILRPLGQGGAGTVFFARDRDTGEPLALKKLQRMDQKSVLRFKREFRAVADLHHPNLIRLYDLEHGSEGWFLAMEYLDGRDLLQHLGLPPAGSLAEIEVTREGTRVRASREADSTAHSVLLFHQLAGAIQALHHAGMLHRDLKPGNVMVSNGRVVVLDFGLVRELDAPNVALTQEGFVSGTPAYMAPEQARGEELTEAADWYAFGVMLYQALSGGLPIDGHSALELLVRKTEVDPTPLDRFLHGVSPELHALCMSLLQRDPGARPSGADVVRILDRELAPTREKADARTPDSDVRTESRQRAANNILFGRERELDVLQTALDQSLEGSATVVHVRGNSGAGKTALVDHFLTRLEAESHTIASPVGRRALVLRSRCYEREAMPFKALDGVIDALVRYLSERDDFELGHLLPVDISELVQLFPALERLPGIARLAHSIRPKGDALQLRQRGEAALRELFARLSKRTPLVLWIDDLQWGDMDSAAILRDWPQELAHASLLLVFSYRSDEVATSECLRLLLEQEQAAEPASDVVAAASVIDITTLDEPNVRTLCAQRLGPLAADRPDVVNRIVAEAHGNPFLVLQLTALVQVKHARGDADLAELTIDHLVVQARELLPPRAAKILDVLALAGRPIAPKAALLAAGVRNEGQAMLHSLRGLRLIRTREIGGQHLIEVYHDRVREAVHASLDSEACARIHANLLEVVSASGQADADWLHSLALGAGRRADALRYGLAAAERAANGLAFERAAALYQTCLTLTDPSAPGLGGLWLELATALALCRRGTQAADAYLEAAKYASREQAVELMRQAASHLLRCGEFARGEVIVERLLEELDLELPKTDAGLMAAIAWERARLHVRGLGFQRRTEQEAPAATLRNSDFFAHLSIETQPYDPMRAALLQARSLRWALDAGEPRALINALCVSATMACVSGSSRSERRADALLARAEDLARELGNRSLHANVYAARAVCGLLLGRPDNVLAHSYEAERMYRADVRDSSSYYYRLAVVAVRIGALQTFGENRRAETELQEALREAHNTHNSSAVLQLAYCQAFADETQNRANRSKALLEEQRQLLPKGAFGTLHLLHMLAVIRIACSTHDYAWASAWVEEDWARWRRSPARASAFFQLLALGGHSRFILNRHVVQRESGDPAALVRDHLRALGSLPFEYWRTAARARTCARLAILAGEHGRAAELLREGISALAKTGAAAEQMRDRYALGMLIGGDEGAVLCDESNRTMRERGVVDPLVDLHANYPELIAAVP